MFKNSCTLDVLPSTHIQDLCTTLQTLPIQNTDVYMFVVWNVWHILSLQCKCYLAMQQNWQNQPSTDVLSFLHCSHVVFRVCFRWVKPVSKCPKCLLTAPQLVLFVVTKALAFITQYSAVRVARCAVYRSHCCHVYSAYDGLIRTTVD